jgi:hypothetical protein
MWEQVSGDGASAPHSQSQGQAQTLGQPNQWYLVLGATYELQLGLVDASRPRPKRMSVGAAFVL